MYLTWGPSTSALASGCPLYLVSFYSTDLLQHRSLTAIGQKSSSHSLVFTRDTRNKDRERNLGQAHLCLIFWTIGTMEWTSGQRQVKQSLFRSISSKNSITMATVTGTTVVPYCTYAFLKLILLFIYVTFEHSSLSVSLEKSRVYLLLAVNIFIL